MAVKKRKSQTVIVQDENGKLTYRDTGNTITPDRRRKLAEAVANEILYATTFQQRKLIESSTFRYQLLSNREIQRLIEERAEARPPKLVQVEVPVEKRVEVEKDQVEAAIGRYNNGFIIRDALNFVPSDVRELMMSRATEFRSRDPWITAIMACIGSVPEARSYFDQQLTQLWANRFYPSGFDSTLVVGSGITAATIALTARNSVAVVERKGSQRIGGSFAITNRPGFYMNSRNRPGELTTPGDLDGSLNHIPNGFIQVADICSDEFPSNDVMAWVIRANLALSGCSVYSDTEISYLDYYWRTPEYGKFTPGRVVVATGLGESVPYFVSPRLLTFDQLMMKMAEPMPLRGMRRVAVIGAGDSGRSAIECLTGQGPAMNMNLPSLDWIEKIDWYGPGLTMTSERWKKINRGRYQLIASLLKCEATPSRRYRVNCFNNATNVTSGYETIQVGSRRYDLVIDCRSKKKNAEDDPIYFGSDEWEPYMSENVPLGDYQPNASNVYRMGVAAYAVVRVGSGTDQLYYADTTTPELRVKENATAIWRMGLKVAQLTQNLGI